MHQTLALTLGILVLKGMLMDHRRLINDQFDPKLICNRILKQNLRPAKLNFVSVYLNLENLVDPVINGSGH